MEDVALRDSLPQKQTLLTSWTYRIPALLYEKESETLLAFAEQRTSPDDASSKNLVMATGKRKKSGSGAVTVEWSEFEVVKEAHLERHRTMNPCPLYDKNSKTLFLFFICVEGTVSERWQIQNYTNKARLCYVTSTDIGQSWSELTDLTDLLDEIKSWATFAVGPGHGIQTEGGRLIVPVYAYVSYCSTSCWSCFCRSKCCKVLPFALALYSDDSERKTWQFGEMLPEVSLECEMAEFFDDAQNSLIYCNARNQRGYRVEAVSGDKKLIFQPTSPRKLTETSWGCQGSVVSFPDQTKTSDQSPDQTPNRWLLFTHPSTTKRTELAVYLNKSPSDPNAWSKPWIINSGPSAYSDLAYIGDGWFACLMERGQQSEIEQIACKVFSYSDVEKGTGE
ncbi:sialidase-3-like [Xyrichtys novacula]|uniref:exo-alpha-sialidase n=1 Tax=Xyrichtys novacula TaxID=13765 RepID=A0AAV1EXW0_XYRNO|nr:sialidase-3-like [Xyrichtys novacula]